MRSARSWRSSMLGRLVWMSSVVRRSPGNATHKCERRHKPAEAVDRLPSLARIDRSKSALGRPRIYRWHAPSCQGRRPTRRSGCPERARGSRAGVTSQPMPQTRDGRGRSAAPGTALSRRERGSLVRAALSRDEVHVERAAVPGRFVADVPVPHLLASSSCGRSLGRWSAPSRRETRSLSMVAPRRGRDSRGERILAPFDSTRSRPVDLHHQAALRPLGWSGIPQRDRAGRRAVPAPRGYSPGGADGSLGLRWW